MSTPALANNAYQLAAQLQQQAGKANSPASGMEQPNFGDMVQDALTGMVEQGKAADQKAMGMIEGKTDVVDVVTAIAETEVALETMVTVRDRVISAYEEIMRMPI